LRASPRVSSQLRRRGVKGRRDSKKKESEKGTANRKVQEKARTEPEKRVSAGSCEAGKAREKLKERGSKVQTLRTRSGSLAVRHHCVAQKTRRKKPGLKSVKENLGAACHHFHLNDLPQFPGHSCTGKWQLETKKAGGESPGDEVRELQTRSKKCNEKEARARGDLEIKDT